MQSVFQIKAQLPRCQLAQEEWARRPTQQGQRPQQNRRIGQQAHHPSQSQTVEEKLTQPQLVFLVGLRGLNPRAHLLQQSLTGSCIHRYQTQKCFVSRGWISKLPRALTGLPALRAKRLRMFYAEPMLVRVGLVAQPLQGLSLRTNRLGRRFKRSHQIHVLLEPSNHCHMPTFAQPLFAGRVDVTHIPHDNIWPPLPAPPALLHTGNQQAAFTRVGWGCPTDQRHQQDPAFVSLNPQPQRVLLVAQKESALTRLERARTNGRTLGRIASGTLFLCPEAEAGRSVASIRATETLLSVPVGSSGSNKCWLIWRRPLTPRQARNWLSIHTSGMAWRLGRRAKPRQAFCSGNIWTNRLKEWTGLNRANRCRRHNWAGLNCRRRPRPRLAGINWLIKSSGTWGESSLSSAAVPVGGSNESIAFRAILKNSLRLLEKRTIDFLMLTFSRPIVYNLFPNTLYMLMGNHYHLLVETPEGNLVAGMKWLRSAWQWATTLG